MTVKEFIRELEKKTEGMGNKEIVIVKGHMGVEPEISFSMQEGTVEILTGKIAREQRKNVKRVILF